MMRIDLPDDEAKKLYTILTKAKVLFDAHLPHSDLDRTISIVQMKLEKEFCHHHIKAPSQD